MHCRVVVKAYLTLKLEGGNEYNGRWEDWTGEATYYMNDPPTHRQFIGPSRHLQIADIHYLGRDGSTDKDLYLVECDVLSVDDERILQNNPILNSIDCITQIKENTPWLEWSFNMQTNTSFTEGDCFASESQQDPAPGNDAG